MLQKIFHLMFIAPLAVMLMASPTAEASRLQPIYKPDPIAVPAGKSISDVKEAIRKALFSLDFKTKDVAPGEMESAHTMQSRGKEYTAVLAIKYDSKTVRISYKDSKELNYDQKSGVIHATYNRWVHNVEKRIRGNLGSY